MPEQPPNADGPKLEVFLAVERTGDGYIETDPHGTRTRYFKHRQPDAFELKNLNVLRRVDPRTGVARYAITAVTEAAFRAIGTQKAFPIWDVLLAADGPPNQVLFRSRFGHGGHQYGTTLQIGVSEAALTEIVRESRDAPTPRSIEVRLSAPSLYGKHADTPYDGLGEKTLLLPYWADQPGVRKSSEPAEIEVEWTYDLEAITVCPERRSSMLGGEQDARAQETIVRFRGPLGVFRESPTTGSAPPAEAPWEEILKAIRALRIPLYAIGAAAILLAIKLLR